MPVSSMQIQQMMMQQNAMFAGQMQYAQQLGAPMQAAMGMPAPAPWQVPAYAMQHAAAPYGERLATGMASFASNVAAPTMMGAGALMGGLGMLGPAGRLFDPFGSALSGGMAGFASGGGIAGAMGGAAMGALPGYLAMKAADVYGGAFMGGVQDQSNVNNVLRSNFRFYGGSGPMGRGFSQGQMGQIGNVLQGTARGDLTTSMGELTQLTQMGAQMGQFSGVRDVQQFSQKFKQMLSTLRTIQDELGGSLTEAMTFMRNANQNGVFRNLDSYAAQMRTAQGTTGMSMDQLNGMAMQGAGLSQMMGGRRAQGAVGALRTASSLGAALSSGVINSEALQEATGLSGAEGIQALTGRLMEHTAQFSRRAMGRYSIFGMSNAQGTGLDETAVNAMLSGSTSAGELSRDARRNVRGMGRARAINNEGLLRGALLEQGGLAGQIGNLRMALGDRVMDQGDDYASLFMQRRMRISRPEAEIMTSLMRNQGAIAEQEAIARVGARRETAQNRELQEHRSMDSFFAHMGHALEEGTGVTAAREAGRRFVTRMSQLSEKVMHRLLGISEQTLSAAAEQRSARFSLGRDTAEDRSIIGAALTSGGAGAGTAGQLNLRQQGLFETGASVETMLRNRRVNITDHNGRADAGVTRRTIEEIEAARRGFLPSGQSLAGVSATQLMDARMHARGAAERRGSSMDAAYYAHLERNGISALQADAYSAQNQMSQFVGAPTQMSLFGRDILTTNNARRTRNAGIAGATGGAATGAVLGSALGPLGTVAGGILGGIAGGALAMYNDASSGPNAAAYIASGGGYARELERNAEWNNAWSEARRGGRTARREQVAGRRQGRLDLAEGLRGSNQENVQGVLDSEEYKTRIREISGLNGNELRQKLESMAAWAGQASTEEERAARDTVVAQVLRSAERNGMRGNRLNSEFTSSLRAEQAAERERDITNIQDRGNFLRRMGGDYERLGARMGDVRREMGMPGFDGGRYLEQLNAARQSADERLIGMSASDLRQHFAGLESNFEGASDEQKEMFRAHQQDIFRRQDIRERLSGEGRRGRRGASETAWNLLSGGNVEGVQVGEGRNRREITGRRQIMEQLRRSAGRAGSAETAEFRDLAEQIRQSSGSGLSQDAFRSLVRETAQAGGNFGENLRARLEQAGQDPAVARRAQENLMQQQAARDPQGAQQLTELQGINRAVTRMADRGGPDAPAPGE